MRAIIAPVIFPFLVVSPKDSFRFNLFHLNRRNRQRNRQIYSVPSQNWSSLMVMNVRVHIQYTPKRKQNCVTLNRLATHRICATDPLQMIGSRVLVIINFALFLYVSSSFFSASSSPLGFFIYLFEVNHY
jgi:hypothetical protein